MEQVLVTAVQNWRIEDGQESWEVGPDICHAPVIEHQERETLWYLQHFAGKGLDDSVGPHALSILREETKVRSILWLSSGPVNLVLPIPSSESLSPADIIKRINPSLTRKKIKEVKRSGVSGESSLVGFSSDASVARLEADFVRLETQVASRSQTYKFGILYVKSGQKTEEEMFNNRVSSTSFKTFCKILGEKIELRDWTGYAGGLDTKGDRTGKHSISTRYCGYEIMFHVSTMLPWAEGDIQQIERKRHIGNDVVIIAFMEEGSSDQWCPTIISARFPHVYAVVQPITLENGATVYYVNFTVKETVSAFGPPLPDPPIFHDPFVLRSFLLSKLINGERETIRSVPDFHNESAFLSSLQNIYEKTNRSSSSAALSSNNGLPGAFYKDSPLFQSGSSGINIQVPSSGSSRDLFKNLMPPLPHSTSSSKLNVSTPSLSINAPGYSTTPSSANTTPTKLSRDMMVGSSSSFFSEQSVETLKAPASLLATTEQVQAFQNKPVILNFPTEITCCDSWDEKLLVGTLDGLFICDLSAEPAAQFTEVKCQIHKGQQYRHNAYKQITVIESLGVAIALIPKIGVLLYDLTSLESESPSELLLNKTKHTQSYALGTLQEVLHLACATPRGVFLLRWEADSFLATQEIHISAPTVLEFDPRGYIIAGSPGEYAFIKPDLENPTMHSLYSWNDKERPMEPIDVLIFEDTGEYLLCFDSVGFFVHSSGGRSRAFDIRWTSTPNDIVAVPPYLLVFTELTLEVRYISNGALVQLFDIDSRQDKTVKFLTTGNGIYFATIGSRDSGSSAAGAGKDAATANAAGSQSYPPSLGSSTSSLATTSSSSSSSHGFNLTTSTIHSLRLNAAQSSMLANPGALASPYFHLLGYYPPNATPNPTGPYLSTSSRKLGPAVPRKLTPVSSSDMLLPSAGSSPHSPSTGAAFLGNDGTASFDDSDDYMRNTAVFDESTKPRRRKATSVDNTAQRQSIGSSGGGVSPNAVYPGGMSPLLVAKFRSSEEVHSSGAHSFARFGDDATSSRMSNSAKVARRKSLALEPQPRQKHIRRGSGDTHPQDQFDFEMDGSPRVSASSESPRPSLSGSSPVAPVKSRRKASDKLSGSGERSPRKGSPHELKSPEGERRKRQLGESPQRTGSVETRSLGDRAETPSKVPRRQSDARPSYQGKTSKLVRGSDRRRGSGASGSSPLKDSTEKPASFLRFSGEGFVKSNEIARVNLGDHRLAPNKNGFGLDQLSITPPGTSSISPSSPPAKLRRTKTAGPTDEASASTSAPKSDSATRPRHGSSSSRSPARQLIDELPQSKNPSPSISSPPLKPRRLSANREPRTDPTLLNPDSAHTRKKKAKLVRTPSDTPTTSTKKENQSKPLTSAPIAIVRRSKSNIALLPP